MKKRFLATLLCVCMVLTLLPAMSIPALAAPVTADYTANLHTDGKFYTGTGGTGTDITAAMAAAGAVVGGSPGNRTLTLTNFNFETTSGRAMYLHEDTTIILSGDNTLKSLYSGASNDSIAIHGNHITIMGDGSLTAMSSGNSTSSNHGIEGYSITINSGTVTAIGDGGTWNGAFYPNYTVPNGYKYTVSANTDGSAPTSGVSDGSFVVNNTYKYAKIEYALPSSEKDITAFTIPGQSGSTTIGSDTVAITMPYGTNVTALVPSIALSPGATVSPLSGVAQDFTSSVTYTVTAANASTKPYTVTITVSTTPPSSGSGVVSNSVSPATAAFDKTTGAANNKDIVATLTVASGSSLSAIKNGGTTLVEGTDYTKSGNTYTIKTAYLATLPIGTATLTFDMSSGADPELKVTVTETDADGWANPFIDVNASDWFYGDVKYVHQNGLFAGTSANTFSPNMPMTRGMVVTVLGRLAGINIADYSGASFDDVDTAQYYAPYVKWAAELGIVSGVGDNKFAPDANISRQDLAVILNNYAEKMNLTAKQILQNVVFVDSGDIAGYAVDAVGAMVRAGVINGREDGRFDPTANATRAEVAAMLHRFCEAVK